MFGKKSEFDTTMRNLKSRHLPLVADHRHAAREAALDAAKQAATDAADVAIAAAQQRIVEVKAARDAHHAELEDAAEQAHYTRDSAIAADGFPALAARAKAFLDNPCRATTVAFRETVDQLEARTQLELGKGLSNHQVACALADAIMARPGFAGAVNVYASDAADFGGGAMVSAGLSVFRRARGPAEMQAALEQVESGLLKVAHRTANTTPQPDRVALYELKKRHATRAALSRAMRPAAELIAERKRARDNARIQAEAPPPKVFVNGEQPSLTTRFDRGVAVEG